MFIGKGMGKGLVMGPMGPGILVGPGMGIGGVLGPGDMGHMAPSIMVPDPRILQIAGQRQQEQRQHEHQQELDRERQRARDAERAEQAARQAQQACQRENAALQRELRRLREAGAASTPDRRHSESRASHDIAEAVRRSQDPQHQVVRVQPRRIAAAANGEGVFSHADADLAEALRRSMQPEHQVIPARRPNEMRPRPSGSSVPQLPYSLLAEMCDGFRHSGLLGSGAFGKVYKGLMQGSAQQVHIAVKVFNRHGHGNTLADFQRELQMMSCCRHPNIVPILYVSSDDERHLCIVMPFMADGSLEDLLTDDRKRSSCLSLQRLGYARDIFEGLSYLHSVSSQKPRIVHRDIKPDNILLHGHLAKLGDVGLAKDLNRAYTMTGVGGTALYIDPAYAQSGRLSPASDVYSAGVVLLQLLTGADSTILSAAFQDHRAGRRWEATVRTAQATLVADPVVQWSPNMLSTIHTLGARCTELSQDRRPESSSVRDELERVLSGSVSRAPPATRQQDCMICLSEPRQGVFRPCGHNVCCESCFQELMQRENGRPKCPYCRRHVNRFERGQFVGTFPRGP
jgi:serine/threonine protein kinase